MTFKPSMIRQAILLAISCSVWNAYASEFNTDVLDAEDIENVDMSQFAVAGYVLPGKYTLTIFVNGQRLGAPREITVFEQDKNSEAASQEICIPADMIDLIGLKESEIDKVKITHDGQCLDLSGLTGVQTKIELSSLSLKITIPQSWMEYNDPNWVPPALWEEGINGAFIDYSANASVTDENDGGKRTYLSTNGIAGVNLGAWRFRADYSANYQKQQNGSNTQEFHQFDFNRLYAFT